MNKFEELKRLEDEKDYLHRPINPYFYKKPPEPEPGPRLDRFAPNRDRTGELRREDYASELEYVYALETKYGLNAPVNVSPKLEVSKSTDPSELEADAIAEKITNMSEADIIQNSTAGVDMIQAKAGSEGITVSPDMESEINNISGGTPLSETEKQFYGQRFGVDFDNVTIYDDGKSHQLADNLNARAFTTGNNIVFGKGERTHDKKGIRLMAHELTHVLQNSYQLAKSKIKKTGRGSGVGRELQQTLMGIINNEETETLRSLDRNYDSSLWATNRYINFTETSATCLQNVTNVATTIISCFGTQAQILAAIVNILVNAGIASRSSTTALLSLMVRELEVRYNNDETNIKGEFNEIRNTINSRNWRTEQEIYSFVQNSLQSMPLVERVSQNVLYRDLLLSYARSRAFDIRLERTRPRSIPYSLMEGGVEWRTIEPPYYYSTDLDIPILDDGSDIADELNRIGDGVPEIYTAP